MIKDSFLLTLLLLSPFSTIQGFDVARYMPQTKSQYIIAGAMVGSLGIGIRLLWKNNRNTTSTAPDNYATVKQQYERGLLVYADALSITTTDFPEEPSNTDYSSRNPDFQRIRHQKYEYIKEALASFHVKESNDFTESIYKVIKGLEKTIDDNNHYSSIKPALNEAHSS
jgi:hypothetical protein